MPTSCKPGSTPSHDNNGAGAGARDSGPKMSQCSSGCLSPVSLQAEAPALDATCRMNTKSKNTAADLHLRRFHDIPQPQNGKQACIETVNVKRTPTPLVPVSASNLHRTPPQQPREGSNVIHLTSAAVQSPSEAKPFSKEHQPHEMLTRGVHLQTLVRCDMAAPSNEVRGSHHHGLRTFDRTRGCDGASSVLQDRRKRRSRRAAGQGPRIRETYSWTGGRPEPASRAPGIHAVSGDLGTF